jgi:multisubunit Na+/H+ antiporter MnhE subunit
VSKTSSSGIHAASRGKIGGMTRREFIEAAVWWAVLFGAYLAIISTISPTEIVVGAATGAAGAASAVLTRRTLLAADNDERYRPRARWLRWLLLLPGEIVAGFARLLVRPRGEFTEIHLPADGRPAARRGFTALALSVAPNTYVADVDPDRDTVVIHRIGERPSALEREVSR